MLLLFRINKKIKTYDCIYHHYNVYIDAVYFQYAGWDDDVISTQWTHELPNHILEWNEPQTIN